jgi:hypothetical protein
MKTKTAYWISAQKRIKDNDGQINYVDRSQYLLPNELHLIKTMLNDDVEIIGVRKDQLTIAQYKTLFG